MNWTESIIIKINNESFYVMRISGLTLNLPVIHLDFYVKPNPQESVLHASLKLKPADVKKLRQNLSSMLKQIK